MSAPVITTDTGDWERGFIRYVIRSPLAGADFSLQLVSVTRHALALEVVALLESEFPAGTLSITRWAAEPKELAEAERVTEAVAALMIDVLQADRPAHAFLVAIGYRPKPTEV